MKKKILLVDDVRLFLKLEETFLKRTGCEIYTAGSGAEALDVAQKKGPDLILLDFIMPDMMGDEVCKRLKSNENTRPIPIMIVSTSADADDIAKCFAAGAQDYVTKPINAQELLAKAANILNIPNRLHYRVPVSMKVEGESSGKAFTGMSKNISQGGILVESPKNIPVSSHISLEVPVLPNDRILNFTGKVARTDRDESEDIFYLGIQFVDLTPEQNRALDAFINRHEKRAK